MAIVLFAIIARLVLVASAEYLSGDDGRRYLQTASNLVQFGVFSADGRQPPSPTAHDLPVYPLLLAALIHLTGEPATAALAASYLNAIFFGLTVAGVYRLAALLLLSRFTALIAAATFALAPEGWPYSVFYMPESMFLCLLIWSQALLVWTFRTWCLRRAILSFGLLGLSVLTKPIAMFYVLVAGALMLLFSRHLSPRSRVAWLAVGVVVYLMMLAPWVWRNDRAFGLPAISTITGTNLFQWNCRFLLEDLYGEDEAQRRLDRLKSEAKSAVKEGWNNPIRRANALGVVARKEILRHLPSYLWLTAKSQLRMFAGTGAVALLRLLGDEEGVKVLLRWNNSPSWRGMREWPTRVLILQATSWMITFAIYLAAMAGLVSMAGQRQWLPLTMLLLTMVYFSAVIGPFTWTRYRLMFAPYLAILAGQGMAGLRRIDFPRRFILADASTARGKDGRAAG